MNRSLYLITVLFVTLLTTSALAQPLPQRCQEKESEIKTMAAGIETMDKEIVSFQTEIDALKKQIEQLEKQLAGLNTKQKDLTKKAGDKKSERVALEKKVKAEKKNKERMCAPLTTCAGYEQELDGLKKSIAENSALRNEIRAAVGENKKKEEGLSAKINTIRTDYKTLKCEKLKSGVAEQATIDRCNQLYAEWVKLEAEVSQINDKVMSVHEKHEKLKRNMRPLITKRKSLQGKMKKTCDWSTRLTEFTEFEKEEKEDDNTAKQFKSLDNGLKKAKKIKFKEPPKGIKSKEEVEKEKKAAKEKKEAEKKQKEAEKKKAAAGQGDDKGKGKGKGKVNDKDPKGKLKKLKKKAGELEVSVKADGDAKAEVKKGKLKKKGKGKVKTKVKKK